LEPRIGNPRRYRLALNSVALGNDPAGVPISKPVARQPLARRTQRLREQAQLKDLTAGRPLEVWSDAPKKGYDAAIPDARRASRSHQVVLGPSPVRLESLLLVARRRSADPYRAGGGTSSFVCLLPRQKARMPHRPRFWGVALEKAPLELVTALRISMVPAGDPKDDECRCADLVFTVP
jgi:hypothetical protein